MYSSGGADTQYSSTVRTIRLKHIAIQLIKLAFKNILYCNYIVGPDNFNISCLLLRRFSFLFKFTVCIIKFICHTVTFIMLETTRKSQFSQLYSQLLPIRVQYQYQKIKKDTWCLWRFFILIAYSVIIL